MKNLSRSEPRGHSFAVYVSDRPQAIGKESDQNVGFQPLLDPVPDWSQIEFAL